MSSSIASSFLRGTLRLSRTSSLFCRHRRPCVYSSLPSFPSSSPLIRRAVPQSLRELPSLLSCRFASSKVSANANLKRVLDSKIDCVVQSDPHSLSFSPLPPSSELSEQRVSVRRGGGCHGRGCGDGGHRGRSTVVSSLRGQQRCRPSSRRRSAAWSVAGKEAQAVGVRGGDDDVNDKSNSFESADDFERHLFGDIDNSPNTNSFYRKLDKIEKAHWRSNVGSKMNDGGHSQFLDGLGGSFDTLSDGMDEKLKKAARTFVYSDEIHDEDYSFRPDVKFLPGMTYTPRDLDLTKPGVQKSFKRTEFQTTTKEVLRKADFRNVRFLSNFITEAGIIIKRRQTRISAKAQRKVAREIKTARAFGLMPFTTMGTKPFIFGRSMKDYDDEGREFGTYDGSMAGATAEPYKEG